MECAVVCPVQIYFYTSLNLFTCLFIDLSDSWDYNCKQKKIPTPNVASKGGGGIPFSSPLGTVRPVSGVSHRPVCVASESIFPNETPGESQKERLLQAHLSHPTRPFRWDPPHLQIFEEQEILQTPLLVPPSCLILAPFPYSTSHLYS